MTDIEQKPYNGHWAISILHSDEAGIFDRLSVDESIRDNVVEEDLWVQKGEAVESFLAANNAIGTLVLRFDDEAKMLGIIENIRDFVKVVLE